MQAGLARRVGRRAGEAAGAAGGGVGRDGAWAVERRGDEAARAVVRGVGVEAEAARVRAMEGPAAEAEGDVAGLEGCSGGEDEESEAVGAVSDV